MTRTLTYPGGWPAVVDQWQGRRAALKARAGEGLAGPGADLAALAAERVAAPGPLPPGSSAFAVKRHALATEFAGRSALALEHALAIACLRRRAWPDEAPALFRRIWVEEAERMLAELDTRWLISAAITFADHGATESERFLGQSVKILFSLVKLYEFERLYSGQDPDQPFRLGKRSRAGLPMGIEPFSIRDGGLDVNLLGPIWAQAAEEPVMGPLVCHLLERLNGDPGTLFRRLALMREKLQARDARRRAEGG